MNPLPLRLAANGSAGSAEPVFALESNYDYTRKYALESRQVLQAAVTLLLFSDRIVLLPASGNGQRMLAALRRRLPLQPDPRGEAALWLALDANAPLARRLDQLHALLRHFDADPHFGLHGFFTYELIHADSGPTDQLLGIFHLPERLLVDGRPHSYFLEAEAGLPDAETRLPPPDLGRFIDLAAFAGRSQPYQQMYRIAQQAIRTGEVRSVNPSFAIRRPTARSARQLYQALQQRNLAPYNLFFDAGAFQLVGASPAMFLRIRGRQVETSPICGTAARGRDAEEDKLQIEKLLASEKDDFELAECVKADMQAKRASCEAVTLAAAKEIEKFSNVFHTSAHVTAILKPGRTLGDAIVDHLWPATIIGTPAAAAARLLAGHETRHWYGGAFGYLTAAGDVNLGTIIRSALLQDGAATTRVGSTITRHSSEQLEQRELEAKAALILGAL